MPKFRRLECWTEKQCAGGTRIGFVKVLAKDTDGCRALFAIESEENLTTKIPVTAAVSAGIAQGVFLRDAHDDESFHEWRIDSIAESRTHWTVIAKSILNDLADNTLLYTIGADGFPNFSEGLADATATEALEYMLAHPKVVAAGIPDWLGIGTVDCTRILDSIQWDNAGILGFLRAVQAAVRNTGEACEARLRRNGTTGYLIDLLRQIGGDAAVPTLNVGRSLIGDLVATSARRDQSTAVVVRGADLAGLATGIALSRWKVAAITGAGPYVVTLDDPAGGSPPVGADDQYNGNALFREADGTLLEISDSTVTPNAVTLADVGDLAVDDMVQFRTTADPDTATPLVELTHPARVALYGRKVGTFKRAAVVGVPNVMPNAVLRDWSDPDALPDGWTFHLTNFVEAAIPGTETIAKNTDPLYWKTGGQSLSFALHSYVLVSPSVKWTPMYAHQPMSIRVRLLLTAWSAPGQWIRLMLGIRLADGSVRVWGENARSLDIKPLNSIRPAPWQEFAAGVWNDMILKDSDITVPSTDVAAYSTLKVRQEDIDALSVDAQGLCAVLVFTDDPIGPPSGEVITGYLDGVSLTPSAESPPAISEFGGSNILHATANLVLNEVSRPAIEVTVTVLDLERYNPTLNVADKLTLGGNARIPTLPPTDDLLRLIQYEPDFLIAKASRCVFSSRRRLFTDLIVNSGSDNPFAPPGSLAGAQPKKPGGGTTGGGGTSGGGPSITLRVVFTGDVPAIIATVSAGVIAVKFAHDPDDFPDFATTDAATADTSPPFVYDGTDNAGGAMTPGDVLKFSAMAIDNNGVKVMTTLIVEDPGTSGVVVGPLNVVVGSNRVVVTF